MSESNANSTDGIAAIVVRYRGRRGVLLPVLHEIQDSFGFIPKEAVGQIADGLNLSRAEVHGVISFYHDFRHEPGPRVRVCMGEACQAMGSAALLAAAADRLGGQVEPVYCIGNCACAPNIEVTGRYHGRVNTRTLQALLESGEDAA